MPDNDSDGIPNFWDNCIEIPNIEQPDWDNDGVGDLCDNCPDIYNPDQANTYGNYLGDACESPNNITEIENIDNRPDKFSLLQNSPNPFNLSTEIKFVLPEKSHITLELFDISGHKVTTLADENYETGTHTILWNGKNSKGRIVSSGVYFYRLQTAEFTQTKKLILIK